MNRIICCWALGSLVLGYSPLTSAVPESGQIEGLLELPYIYGEEPGKDQLLVPLVLYASHSVDTTRLGDVKELQQLEAYEWSYEQLGASVFGYHYDGDHSWYQLRVLSSGQLGWMRGSGDERFHALSELLSESLTYMTGEWNKLVYATAADASTASELAVEGDEIPVAVAGSAMIERELWLLVVVLADSVCSSTDAPRVQRAGWVPAYSATDTLNIWFYSRGC
jgi:hypothetical protein